MKNRFPILNIWVDPVTKEEALDRVLLILASGDRPHAIFASNPEKNFSVPKDPELHRIYQSADILLPDGIGIVLALRLLHNVKISRIPGSEFIFDLCVLAEKKGHKIFVYGASEYVNSRAVETLKQRYPRLEIAGRSNGYVPKENMSELIDEINRSKAEIVFLALGSPRQEKWFASYADKLEHVKICQGVGGTLDTIAGTVKRAPRIWCNANLEWLYRLLSDPKRIERQKVLPVFVLNILSSWLVSHVSKIKEIN